MSFGLVFLLKCHSFFAACPESITWPDPLNHVLSQSLLISFSLSMRWPIYPHIVFSGGRNLSETGGGIWAWWSLCIIHVMWQLRGVEYGDWTAQSCAGGFGLIQSSKSRRNEHILTAQCSAEEAICMCIIHACSMSNANKFKLTHTVFVYMNNTANE